MKNGYKCWKYIIILKEEKLQVVLVPLIKTSDKKHIHLIQLLKSTDKLSSRPFWCVPNANYYGATYSRHLRIWFGIRRCLWKFLFLFGVFFGTGFLQRIIFLGATFCHMIISFVWVVAGWRKRQITSFFRVLFLTPFGLICTIGLLFRGLMLRVCRITFCSLVN